MIDGLLKGLQLAGDVVDTPGRVFRTAISGGDALGSILDPSKGKSFGLVGDMVADPMNLVGAGAIAKLLKMLGKAKAANLASKAARAAGHMPEEIAKLTKIVDESGKPLRTYHGTPHVFDKYDPTKADPEALFREGIYTTAEPLVASEYSTKGAHNAVSLARRAASRDEDLLSLARKVGRDDDRYNPDLYWNMETTADKAWRLEHTLKDDLKLLARHGGGILSDLNPMSTALGRRISPLLEHFDYSLAEPHVRMQFIHANNPLDLTHEVPRATVEHLFEDKLPNIARRFNMEASQDAHGVSGVALEKAAAKALHTGNLREAGFDALIHNGGLATGSPHHKVVIAFDPSQIYKPYIAPALQAERRAPLAALVAGLGMHNLLASAGSNR